MKEIKSLADKLRDQLRSKETNPKNLPKTKRASPVQQEKCPSPDKEKAIVFFNDIRNFQVELTEKSLIRVDKRTLNLLKGIKLTQGVDMNRFIVYALHQYLSQHPWLSDYINETLKNTES
ncbi:hypothetical protein BWD42_06910 [Sphingobacterium sp. CZ-UAM]|uniref:hypothetical protein n=1 Tax=Sphingobacterium sp. CZ-UAM TaxID=1933868 RepID=UPI0009874E5B|nr:hypothetical protein [Sphingobacterium sp. CZ-UAM]OOG19635.1 hypothetical protein BWD42_06910 [Sphingobacterium sp. CZ-UAM]